MRELVALGTLEFRQAIRRPLPWALALLPAVEVCRDGLTWWRGTPDPASWFARSATFGLMLFLGAAGLFIYASLARRRPLASILACKPVPSLTRAGAAVLGQGAALVLVFAVGWLPTALAFPLVYGAAVDVLAAVQSLAAIALVSVLAWTGLCHAIASRAATWATFLPLWLLGFLGGVMLLPRSLSLVPDYRLTSILPNRMGWLAASVIATALAAAAPAWTGTRLHRPGRNRSLFRPLPSWLALQWYTIKAAFGSGAWIPPLAGALLGAFLTAGPLARAPSEHMRFYVTVFWAEAFLPWLAILMPARGALTASPGLQARLECLPDYQRRQLGHMVVTLLLYHTSVALGFALGGKLFWQAFPVMMTLGAVMPVFLFFSSLPLAAGTWLGRPWLGSLAGAAVWLVAFSLEPRLPWFLNPLFFLAEYEVKLHRYGLWPSAKLLFLGYGIAVCVLALAIRPRARATP